MHSPRLLCIALLGAAAGGALAQSSPPAAQPAKAEAAPLTYLGVTLYGTVDVGLAHLSHGAPVSAYYGPGLPFIIQKFNDRPITAITPNGLGQSRLGLAGDEPLAGDLHLVFRLETGFQPTSGNLADGPHSLVINNGRPLDRQVTAGDSSRAGQLFQGAAYAGVASKRWGSLTFGRQTSILSDNFARYDPQAAAQAFSLLGYTGFTAGAGTTETGRFAPALKYAYAAGPFRIAAAHQFGGVGRYPGRADQADVGVDYRGLSADLTYTHVGDATALASLSAAQNAVAPGTLAATVSDDTAYTLEARYAFGPARLYGGYESIVFANPAHPLAPGVRGIGGYVLSFVNDDAYAIHRVTQVSWIGASYAFTPRLTASAGYYRYDQNSFKGNGCAGASASSCSGQLQDYSLLTDYRFSKRFDVYGGISRSTVANGLAAGFLQTGTTSPMAGARFSF